jgi:6-pyruvoyltetrahydropterin/6-carboxytetrahydropterin synthase
MRLSLTRSFGFRAAHRYWIPEWSAEKNRERFGQLTETHAHDYRCAVTVAGPMDGRTGMLMDLGLLDRILATEALAGLDGKDLNRDVPEFGPGGTQPTCEALARWVFLRVAPRLPPGVALLRVQLAEDDTLSAECSAPA